MGAWGPRKEGVRDGLAEKVGKGLAKGWRRVGEGLAKGWRISSHPPISEFPRRPFRDTGFDSMGSTFEIIQNVFGSFQGVGKDGVGGKFPPFSSLLIRYCFFLAFCAFLPFFLCFPPSFESFPLYMSR